MNILDLAFMATYYDSDNPTADLNGDGKVDLLDLVLVAGAYGQPEKGAN